MLPFESYGTFNEFSRVVTKHVLGGQEQFNELKQRLEMCEHANSKAGAAALGYLIAMEEKNDGKETIYDLVLEQVENDAVDSMNRTDSIFTVIYKWLDEKFADGFLFGDGVRIALHEAFEPLHALVSSRCYYNFFTKGTMLRMVPPERQRRSFCS
jgi:hypothetical protein